MLYPLSYQGAATVRGLCESSSPQMTERAEPKPRPFEVCATESTQPKRTTPLGAPSMNAPATTVWLPP